jgi:hypothetical protein
MKNQYVGDINDFAKYAILRALRGPGSQLAVCWMLTRDDSGGDGRHLSYLQRPNIHRPLDPPLFDVLNDLIERGARRLAAIEESCVLHPAVFFSELLDDTRQARRAYFEKFWASVSGGALVFFDPDNGLEVSSVPPGRRDSSKYLYVTEVAETLERGHPLIVYQHFPRVQREAFLSDVLSRLVVLGASESFALYSSRVAFLVSDPSGGGVRLSVRARDVAARSNGLLKYHPVSR